MIRRLSLLALLLAMGGCDGGALPDNVPVVASVIGRDARVVDPSRGPMSEPERVLLGAMAQGLVRFDANGQIEPGLAERWIVIDDGRSYIFRLREAAWSDGAPVTAGEVVAALRRAAAPGSRNALAPFLAVIDEVVEMTPQVIEVRLKRPRPDLLKIFAQPELAILRARPMAGSGPFVIAPDRNPGILLRPIADPNSDPDERRATPAPEELVRLRGESAAMAVSRFRLRRSHLVLGGSFDDWPYAAASQVSPVNIHVDPALGLFGLAVVNREGFLADPANRAAIAMAIDRAALTKMFRPDWAPVETLLPEQLDSADPPSQPDWIALPFDQRRTAAKAKVTAWRHAHPGPLTLRIALPGGPGSNLVWAQMIASLVPVGVTPRRVTMEEDADLRLIDAVAPYDSGRWFLVTACRNCQEDVAALIEAARDAPTLEARGLRISEAEKALTADNAYIPFSRPLRWSMVAQRLGSWEGNPRAWHPLNHLRNEGE